MLEYLERESAQRNKKKLLYWRFREREIVHAIEWRNWARLNFSEWVLCFNSKGQFCFLWDYFDFKKKNRIVQKLKGIDFLITLVCQCKSIIMFILIIQSLLFFINIYFYFILVIDFYTFSLSLSLPQIPERQWEGSENCFLLKKKQLSWYCQVKGSFLSLYLCCFPISMS